MGFKCQKLFSCTAFLVHEIVNYMREKVMEILLLLDVRLCPCVASYYMYRDI